MTRVVWLPYPPATNNLFMNAGKRRIRTPRYDAWIAAAHVALRSQKVDPLAGPYALSMIVERPDRRKRDLDGLIKPVLDILVKAGLTADDSECATIKAAWHGRDPVKDAQVIVTLEAA